VRDLDHLPDVRGDLLDGPGGEPAVVHDDVDLVGSGSGRGTDLRELVREVVEHTEVLHPERNIELEASGDLSGDWDRPKISNVIRNLVLNAVEHGREDTPVRVSVRDSGDEVLMEVHNRGAPIPRDISFVMDVSGSMRGEKLQQARDAGVALLRTLRPADRFRIVAF
jgi:light-regulated signal transduction histidine kinase (bacteriophytochrome)